MAILRRPLMHCLAVVVGVGFVGASKVFVMLPLDTVTNEGDLKEQGTLASQLDQLKGAQVDGIMTDVWWGVTEPNPKAYNFHAYQQLVKMAKDRGMKVQFVTSFHSCGGNVGDSCNIPLPSFLTGTGGIWYKDHEGNEDKEYISLFADNATVGGRTPLQMYSDWFAALASTFAEDLGNTVRTLQISMGPAGELRYPAYQLSHWHFCGVGAFQCWDNHALASLKTHAVKAGHDQWTSPPIDAGSYNSQPGDVPFFRDGYTSEYGKFFLNWYFSSLKNHGAAVLARAHAAFGGKVALTAKVSGIHWWFKSQHHAAELTAGYYNTGGRDAYAELAEVFAANGKVGLDFTCLEMTDSEQPSSCSCGPEELVGQVVGGVRGHGITFSGENALPRYDANAYGKIESYRGSLDAFTYLRLSSDLFQDDNFNNFRDFVAAMHSEEAVHI